MLHLVRKSASNRGSVTPTWHYLSTGPVEALHVGAGDWLDRPLEEGAMPKGHSQPIQSILTMVSWQSCFRASVTVNTQYNLNIPRNIIPGARAVQANTNPVPWETGHNYSNTRRCSRQVKIRVFNPSYSKRPFLWGWSTWYSEATMVQAPAHPTSEKGVCTHFLTSKLLSTTMLTCESQTVKIKDAMQT